MDNLGNRFYKNQDIIFKTPQKKFRGFIDRIEGGFLYILLYASSPAEKQHFSNYADKDEDILNGTQALELDKDGYDIDKDLSLIKNSTDFNLICPGLYQTFTYKPVLKNISKSAKNISLKIEITGMSAEREGREFLRIKATIQFIYEEISVKEFLDTKDAYISKPSFTTSVYGIYNMISPKIYQSQAEGDTEAPVNPHIDRLLIAINSKLDVILSLLNPEASIFADVKEKIVSISGSGVMWTDKKNDKNRNLKQGSIIKITMLFPAVPQFVIKAQAQVVKVYIEDKNDLDDMAIACKFIAVNESDRDEIIKFTLEKQRQQIKKSS